MRALGLIAMIWLACWPRLAGAQSAPAPVPAATASNPAADAAKAGAKRLEAPASNAAPASGSALSADEIMARVAANQDRSDALRNEYIYHQHIRVMSQKANGTRMRDEVTDYAVTPTEDGTKKELTSI